MDDPAHDVAPTQRPALAPSTWIRRMDRATTLPVVRLWPIHGTLVGAMVAGVLSFVVFATISVRKLPTDLRAHVQIALDGITTGEWIADWLFFRTIAVLSSNSTDKTLLTLVAVGVMAIAVAAKYAVSVGVANRWLAADMEAMPDDVRQAFARVVAAGVFALLWASNLPMNGWRDNFYIGQFPPNVWHNATTIFLMPFAVGLFWSGWRYLVKPSRSLLLVIAVLSVANVLAKPSYAITFSVAFPILLLCRHRLLRPTLEALPVLLVPAALMAYQAHALFVDEANAQNLGSVAVDPFAVWSLYSDSFTMSMLVSFAFPVVAFLAHPRIASRSVLFVFAAVNLVVSIAVYALLTETGPRQPDANFSWQVIVANYLMFLAAFLISVRAWARNEYRIAGRDWIVVATFALHVLAGLVYVARYFILDRFT